MLLDSGLVRQSRSLHLAPQLAAATHCGDSEALVQIARLMFITAPPVWLTVAVENKTVTREYIPAYDLEALSWLEPELDRVILDAYAHVHSTDRADWQKKIGDAAELFIVAALRFCGHNPVHVALISDVYGYDIEVEHAHVDRIEVKGAGPRTAWTFHLSRNEFEKSQEYGEEWRLVQVAFRSSAFVAKEINPSHIEAIYELDSLAVRRVVPPDPPGFLWEKTALITPPKEDWRPSGLVLDPGFTLPGFGFC
ncbi:protein NO VEIN domain-containing protein [Nocardia nova]|uniref:protein NO VEIN domain-containing protein n=1 Tax=Nocardia nova TaxID=37330 RepID=UPI00189551C0|nr:DUF3883 domain-containing protein [Nocardia nova]MBF6150208.1 DUF3883 domain-containing protein [Nocardia nova]